MIRKLIIDKTQVAHLQFLRYFFVGGSAAVIDLLTFTVMVTYMDIHWALAAFIGYMWGLAWNYFLCVYWVFESKHNRAKEFLMIFLIAIGGLIWTELILFGLIGSFGLDEVISKAISQIIVLFWNFGMRKFYVFH